ncbi:hypothetical protein BpHYR1_007460 [Brachionus plicatilis]|uniref:Uncharacterized protein n=1 Tax=Brachionus plicatilis TaxID=10195 RepID=A0A3M7Q581_BRAPC|nr:hypothetical protein BpHYR1_007460 [Brachionus plicatilis]
MDPDVSKVPFVACFLSSYLLKSSLTGKLSCLTAASTFFDFKFRLTGNVRRMVCLGELELEPEFLNVRKLVDTLEDMVVEAKDSFELFLSDDEIRTNS